MSLISPFGVMMFITNMFLSCIIIGELATAGMIDRKNYEVTLRIYTHNNIHNSGILTRKNMFNEKIKYFNRNDKSVLIIPKMGERNFTSGHIFYLKNTYIQGGNNIIIADWNPKEGPIFSSEVIEKIPQIGADIVSYLFFLHHCDYIDIAHLEVIGLRIGAHIAAAVAKYLRFNELPKLKSITGIMPKSINTDYLRQLDCELDVSDAEDVKIYLSRSVVESK